MVTRRGMANEPRNVAIYLVRRYTEATFESIGREFNLNKYSSVGSVIERMRGQILEGKRLRKRIAELEKKLIMSHEQIDPSSSVLHSQIPQYSQCDLKNHLDMLCFAIFLYDRCPIP